MSKFLRVAAVVALSLAAAVHVNGQIVWSAPNNLALTATTLTVNGNEVVTGTLSVSGAVSTGPLTVTGAVTASGLVTATTAGLYAKVPSITESCGVGACAPLPVFSGSTALLEFTVVESNTGNINPNAPAGSPANAFSVVKAGVYHVCVSAQWDWASAGTGGFCPGATHNPANPCLAELQIQLGGIPKWSTLATAPYGVMSVCGDVSATAGQVIDANVYLSGPFPGGQLNIASSRRSISIHLVSSP